MPVGDAMFHAHRFQEVLGGQLLLHVDCAGQLPVPVRAGPLRLRDRRSPAWSARAADMALLRTIVCVVDAVRDCCSTRIVARVRGDRLAGALAVALYHLIPLGFGVMAVGNLTNAFAQSVSVAALALMACRRSGCEQRARCRRC